MGLGLALGPAFGLALASGRRAAAVPARLGPNLVRVVVPAVLGSVLAGSGVVHAGTSPSPAPSGAPWRARPAQLGGLLLPDRVVGGPLHRHRVRPGESLWVIAERWLPGRPHVAAVDRAWRAVYRRNRSAIGPDPDLIHPGLLLRRPPNPDHRGVPR
jgi:hypothetical protein